MSVSVQRGQSSEWGPQGNRPACGAGKQRCLARRLLCRPLICRGGGAPACPAAAAPCPGPARWSPVLAQAHRVSIPTGRREPSLWLWVIYPAATRAFRSPTEIQHQKWPAESTRSRTCPFAASWRVHSLTHPWTTPLQSHRRYQPPASRLVAPRSLWSLELALSRHFAEARFSREKPHQPSSHCWVLKPSVQGRLPIPSPVEPWLWIFRLWP